MYRTLRIEVRLLGASHDDFLGLVYHEVQAYLMQQPLRGPAGPIASVAHGDWLTDELRLSETGHVVHEVRFAQGGRWSIECGDVEVSWRPFGG